MANHYSPVLAKCGPFSQTQDRYQSIQPRHSCLALAIPSGQAVSLDERGKLGPLFRAAGEAGKIYPAGA